MPTGVALRDPRGVLFDAADRILLCDGPSALTSRAVTAEAGVSKAVLHRHFTNFDAFLTALIEDRIIDRVDAQAAALDAAVGRRTVADNITSTLTGLFTPAALATVALATSRNDLRARLCRTTPAGIPLVTDVATIIATYLAAEQRQGRIVSEADTGLLASMLAGTCYLLLADHKTAPPSQQAVLKIVKATLANATP